MEIFIKENRSILKDHKKLIRGLRDSGLIYEIKHITSFLILSDKDLFDASVIYYIETYDREGALEILDNRRDLMEEFDNLFIF